VNGCGQERCRKQDGKKVLFHGRILLEEKDCGVLVHWGYRKGRIDIHEGIANFPNKVSDPFCDIVEHAESTNAGKTNQSANE
jgi:hypothetical protein